MTHLVKRLPSKQRDLSQDPQHTYKNANTYNHRSQEVETGLLAKSCLKNKVESQQDDVLGKAAYCQAR